MRALYAFSGDPITYGHIDIVERAARTYERLTVAIGENPEKRGRYLLTRAERLALARHSLRHLPNVECVAFNGLLGEYSYRKGYDVIIRGVRNNSDLEGELVLFGVVESLHPSVDMVFFPTRRHLSHISSGIVKAIVAEGGDVTDYCPVRVKEALEKKLLGKFFVGVAGGIAAGKTLVAKKLVERIREQTAITYISLDEVGHYVLSAEAGGIYRRTREAVAERFGDEVMRADGSIDRRALGKIVFADSMALAELNEIMREPMLTRLYQQSHAIPEGIIVLEGAILVESQWTTLVNNNVVLVDAPESVRLQRLLDRNGLGDVEALNKIERQVAATERKRIMDRQVRKHGWGHVWEIENTGGDIPALEALAGEIVALAQAPIIQDGEGE